MTGKKLSPGTDVELAVGRAIKRLRNNRGIAQETFAYKAGVNRTYMTDIELGRRAVGIVIMQKIAKALDITLTELMVEVELQMEAAQGVPREEITSG